MIIEWKKIKESYGRVTAIEVNYNYDCEKCNGKGHIAGANCVWCNGTGQNYNTTTEVQAAKEVT